MEGVFATKLLSHGVPSLFHLLSCYVNSLTKGTDIGADGEPLVIVFKLEKRRPLEELHGRRGPGSNIRCSAVVCDGKIKLRICFYDASCFRSVFFFKNNSRSFVYRSCKLLYHQCRILTSSSRKLF